MLIAEFLSAQTHMLWRTQDLTGNSIHMYSNKIIMKLCMLFVLVKNCFTKMLLKEL